MEVFVNQRVSSSVICWVLKIKIEMSGVKYIAIEEFAIKNGSVYQTVVMELLQSRIIYVAKDRDILFKKIKLDI